MRVNVADVRQASTMNYLVRDREVIFNLAGQVSHIDSMRDPHTDLEINCRSQLTLLEACRHHNPGAKVVYASTRQIYGKPDCAAGHRAAPGAADRRQRHQQGRRRVLPPRLQQRLRRARVLAAADQRLRPAPADQAQPPGLHRLVHPPGARGPGDPGLRRRLADPRLRLRGRCRRRVSARRARPTRATARSFNVGGDEHIAHRDLVQLLVEIAGTGRYRFVEWPAEKKAIDIGSFYADSTRFTRRHRLAPAVSLRDGLARTLAFYREHLRALRRRRGAPPPHDDPLQRARARRGCARRSTRRSTA